jgi:anaerobic selenocysteine-containing dehydrogenase
MPRTHFRTCNLCEAMCGVAITVEGDRILKIEGDDDDPFSRGHICPKAVGLKDVHEDPDRLRRPLKRTSSGTWTEIDWDTAFDEVADRLLAIQRAHGRDSVALYQGNPTVHNHGTMLFGQLLSRSLRTKSRFSATSLDQLPQMLAALTMFGHQLLIPIPDVDRTDYMLILGANPVASNGSLMTAPGIERRLKAIRARGGKIVVVDPRFTETSKLADRHLFIRPGSDALLLLALIDVVFRDRGPKLGALTAFTDGVDRLRTVASEYPPERVEAATGIAAAEIRTLAHELSDAKSSVVYGRVGLCTQEFGGLASWLLNALNIITGNFDRAGGAMFTKPAIDLVEVATRLGQSGHFDRRRTRVRNLPEFGGEYPAAALAEEIETPGPGQLKALVTSAGNPVLSSPNGVRLEKALSMLEFMVSIDIYLNETTRHANIILPPTFALEHDHYDLAFHALAVRNTAKYCEPLFERGPDQRHDWEILLELSTRLDAKTAPKKLVRSLKQRALHALGPSAVLDLGLRTGPWGAGIAGIRGKKNGLTLAKLKKEPHGVDLGPLEPCLPDRLRNAERRIALVPELYLKDLARLEKKLATPPHTNGQLALIGRRELRSNNSWMHNSERLVKGKERCTVLMHPRDAEARGLSGGEKVSLTSRAGTIVAELELDDAMMPGVVSLPHGWGHHRPGTRLQVAAKRPGVSINDLTDEMLLDDLTGNVRFSDVPVTIARA